VSPGARLRSRRLYACAAALASFALLGSCAIEPELPAGEIGSPGHDHGPGAELLVRPDSPNSGLQFRFDPEEVVERHDSPGGRFAVHYTRAGRNAVPSADADSSGVPDFVEEVGVIYDEVLGFYEAELGFRAPISDVAASPNGGDDRFDVYLVDFNGIGDGNYRNDGCLAENADRCFGYMLQENDYVGYGYPSTSVANRILASHEFFHAVQAAYDIGQGSVFAEGTAVWATEAFDSSLNDFEYFVSGYLNNPDQPLDTPLPGPVDPFSYGSAIFFQYLEEAHGDGTVLALWEAVENGAGGVADPEWLERLDAVLATRSGATFGEAMVEFARWNLYTAQYADPSVAYERGQFYPRVRIDDVATPYEDPRLRVYHASSHYYGLAPSGRSAMTAALVPENGDPASIEGLTLVLATLTGGDVTGLVELSDAANDRTTIDTSSAERLVVFVVNTATGGESKRPGLCAGTAEEVEACVAALSSGGAGGGGLGGAGGTDDDFTDVMDEGGCGCRTVGGASGGGSTEEIAWGVAFAAALVAARAQRRRRRASTRPAATATS
jgi:MYXO-CTERM domain-containing protein